MILKGTLGENWGGIDRYATRAKGARVLACTFGGDTIPERMREAAALRSARPNLKLVVAQIILAHDPLLKDLTDEQWLRAVEIAKQEHDLRDAAYCVVLHPERHKHLHLYYMRVRPDGTLVSDSHSYRKNETAARRIEQELGLPSPTPVPKEQKVGDRKKSDNATRRGRRKQQTEGESFMETTELSRLTFEAIASSSTAEALEQELANRGIELEWTPNRAGIKLLPIGAGTWLKGSTVSRELSGAKIIAALQRNADLRQTAKQASAAVIGVADNRAKSLTAPRIDRNEALDDITASAGVASRALPLLEADAVRAQAAAGPDPLEFLAPAELAPTVRDDAPLVAAPAASQMPTATQAERDAWADATRKRDERDRIDQDQELQAELRALSVHQLLDLRSSRVDELFLTAALLQKLLNLMFKVLSKVLSISLVRREDSIFNALAARRKLAELADAELERRKRSPASAADRRAALSEHQAALQERDKVLADRLENRRLSAQDPHGAERAEQVHHDRLKTLKAGFDRLQASRGHETVRKRRADRDDARAELRAAEDDVPVAMGLLMVPARRKMVSDENAARAKRLAAAVKRAEAMQAALAEFMDQINAELRREQDAAAEALDAAIKNEAFERGALARELRALPEQLLAARLEVQVEQRSSRAGAAGVATAGHAPPSLVQVEADELAAAEAAEREELRRRLGRGG